MRLVGEVFKRDALGIQSTHCVSQQPAPLRRSQIGRLADAPSPWTSEWLLRYELWKLTGEWHGGGHTPGPDDMDE